MFIPSHNHYHLLRLKEMGIVYWCHSFGAFGISLVLIFIPIFLLKTGYSFIEVLVFLFAQQLFSLVLQYPVAHLQAVFRPHLMLLIGNIWYIIFFGLLMTLTTYNWPLWFLALIWALNRTIYWSSFHYLFSIARAHKRSSQQIAGLSAIIMFATTVAPAFGGIVATYFGITYVYIAAAVLLITAIAPLLNIKTGPPTARIQLSLQDIREAKRDLIANICNGMIVTAEITIWPLFVFLLVTSYAGIGLLSTVIAVASVFLTLYVGRHQKGNDRKFMKRGLTTYGFVSAGRAVAQNTTQIFGLNLFAGVGRSLYVTPFMNRYYSNSDGNHLGYVTAMEMAYMLGATLFFGTLVLLALLVSAKAVLTIGLIIVALSVFGVRLIR